MPSTGSCTCGQCQVTVDIPLKQQSICHCTDCRKSGGCAFSVNALVPGDKYTIKGPVKAYQLKSEGGNQVTRKFCENCGSSLLTATPAFGGAVAIKTSLFDEFPDLPFTGELFTSSRSKHLAAMHDCKQNEKMPS